MVIRFAPPPITINYQPLAAYRIAYRQSHRTGAPQAKRYWVIIFSSLPSSSTLIERLLFLSTFSYCAAPRSLLRVKMESHWCPCPSPWESMNMDDFAEHRRRLQEEDSAPQEGETWEMIYVGVVLLLMFAALLSDKIGADLVMLAALTLCMAGNVITVDEGLSGFSNEGVLTVLVLFVVAAGIQLTGGLDWYMAKLLGRPINTAGAQLRLMVPIAVVSAFLNNTPVVVIMIPICQKWGKNVGISPAQLLVPLSFASILGGTCTLIGTSTNLVVAGLLTDAYPDDPSMQIGLFDLGEFGIPILFIGMSYIIIASPYLLPGGNGKEDTALPEDDGTILLGARLTKWSPAAGRTVKRSGLRDTGGVYLVSVERARSGNIHRAVGAEFVLNVDDILYFTGMVDGFGQFCENHGLEVITNEVDITKRTETAEHNKVDNDMSTPNEETDERTTVVRFASSTMSTPNGETDKRTTVVRFSSSTKIPSGDEIDSNDPETPPLTIETKPARFNVEAEKLQTVNQLTDLIRGYDASNPYFETDSGSRTSMLEGQAKVVVVIDTQDLEDVVIVGINANDRPGLLLSVSRGLHSLGLQLHHTEASVIRNRSISVWRCALIDEGASPNAAEMQASLSSMLAREVGDEAAKKRGQTVIRALVTDQSRLCDKTLEDISFQDTYKAAIIAVRKKDKSEVDNLAEVCFESGDVLVLQANDDSPLLVRPAPDFYDKPDTTTGGYTANVFKSVKGLKLSSSSNDLKEKVAAEAGDKVSISSTNPRTMEVWKDLRVLFHGKGGKGNSQEEGSNMSREFLAAVEVSAKSEHIGKTAAESGLDRQAGLFLVGVERPNKRSLCVSFIRPSMGPLDNPFGDLASLSDAGSRASFNQSNVPTATIPVPPEGHLRAEDILWFAGSATAIADLRKIPGLVSLEDEELKQMDENVHDRRLVQAVVARKGPLASPQYLALPASRHRFPGKIKLQGGDVLLLEAGPTFISRNTDNQQSFALISEVKDSKPPRLDKLIPALALVLSMLIIVAIGPALFPDQNMKSLLVCGLVTSIIMVICKILSQQECRDSINWDVYVTIACAFGIGKAMENSGLASVIADGLVAVGNAVGDGHTGLYGAVYLGTFLISNIVTNNAAAALMFPIAIEAAIQTEADPLLMSYNIMLAASASFMSPYGYTTNLLIYGPGGYKVKDFVK
ncbi:hypothetical protein ACHAXR_010131, partial [Thalassiosira sp. AJA248-18]